MLENVDIVVEEEPTSEQLKRAKLKEGMLLFGLYQGVPQTKRWHYGQVLPDKITIFKNHIEKYAKSEEEIKEIVKNTVWHEIAHHFGIDEKSVRELERKRKIQK
jgi:predicted Zn-dependent protease with MMP-like domain